MTLDEEIQTIWDNVGSALVQLREASGLTQRQAAKLADSTQARISDLENGKADMFISTLQRWAKVYGYSVEIHLVPIEEEQSS